MRKKVIFIVIVILMIVSICSVLFIKDSADFGKFDFKQLKGDLLIENKIDDKNYTFGIIS